MNQELLLIIDQIKNEYEGEPWFGRNLKATLAGIDVSKINIKPSAESHSPLQLLYHIINWRRFAINRLAKETKEPVEYFEANDWREFDDNDIASWQEGLQILEDTQHQLLEILSQQRDEVLDENVFERTYSYRTMLNGILQHDIYHNGQIAFLTKVLK